jgi:DNA-binding SARP family transcriptional activator
MARLELSLFGKFTVRCTDDVVTTLDARKAQELFGYLLLYRKRTHHRERIANLLWSDVPDVAARRYLSKALWQLQSALDHTNLDYISPLFVVDPEWISISREADIWLDIAIFEDAFRSVHNTRGRQLELREIEMIEDAVRLYRGELLEGWYHDWCILERQKLHDQLLQMLDKLIDYFETYEQYENGLHYGRLMLRFDRARERTHRRLMRLYYGAGDRTGARRQYAQCTAALQEELQVAPSARTEDLYQRICRDQMLLSDSNPEPTVVDSSGSLELQSVLLRLQELQTVVQEAHTQLESDIKLLRTLLQE